MNDLLEKGSIDIENMIYEVRGKQVMLDSDLAKLYNVETKRINEAVKNNFEKFPERFSWILIDNEYNDLRSKFSTSSCRNNYGGRRYNPRVFTEQGIAMLATILKSKVATEVSIQIMDAFVTMRKYISSGLLEQKYINNQVFKNTEDIRLLQESFNKLESKEVKNEIYFNGQIYDAYSKIMEIMSKTKNQLIVVDGYVDRSFLNMIKEFKFKIILITKSNTKLTKLDISKYKEEYDNFDIIYDDTFHDRYFILDKDIIYHCGTSINHAGSKTFSINKLEDKVIKESLLNRINEVIKN